MPHDFKEIAIELLQTFVKEEINRGNVSESSIIEKLEKIDADSFFGTWKNTYKSNEENRYLFNKIYDEVINKNSSNASIFKLYDTKDITDFFFNVCEDKRNFSDLITKLIKTHSAKFQNTNTVHEIKETTKRTEIEALKHVIEYGIKLIPVLNDGRYPCKKEGFEKYLTDDLNKIEEYRKEGYSLFRFKPEDSGLLCIDIDVGHSNKIDGIKKFYEFLEKNKIPKVRLPKYLQDIAGGSFPVYCQTPSGGYHLYFKYNRNKIKKQNIGKNVEVFYEGYINSPGSYKGGKPYVFYGDLQNTPNFPPILLSLLKEFKEEETIEEEKRITETQHKQAKEATKKEYTQEELFNYVKADYSFTGRNELCFRYALRAKKEEFTQSEVISFLKNNPETKGHDCIKPAVQSAYRYK